MRYTREVVHEPHRELAEICSEIVEKELHRRANALETIVARNVNAEPFASNLVNFVNSHTAAFPRDLLDALTKPPITFDTSDVMQDESVMYLVRLQAETLSHLYYCATLIEIFAALNETEFTADRHRTGEGSFDALASVRRQFSVNARLAWMTVSRFRAQWDLAPLDPPAVG